MFNLNKFEERNNKQSSVYFPLGFPNKSRKKNKKKTQIKTRRSEGGGKKKIERKKEKLLLLFIYYSFLARNKKTKDGNAKETKKI